VRAHEDMLAGAVGLLERIGPSVLLTHALITDWIIKHT
jgi:hypothetical protein